MKKLLTRQWLTAMLGMAVVALVVTACADNDLDEATNQNQGNALKFAVEDVQQNAIDTKALTGMTATGFTRATTVASALNTGITADDLTPQVYTPTGGGAAGYKIVEHTIEGVNPIASPATTRGNATTKTTLGQFSTTGYRGSSEAGISTTPNYFYNATTNANGSLVNTYLWSVSEPYAKFFAVHPLPSESNGIVLSGESYEGTPYVDFTVQSDVTEQQDLLTAATGTVNYTTPGTAPEAPLYFRHALTAIKFVAGTQLRPGRAISKIEIRNALSTGRYTLPTKTDGSDAAWSDVKTAATFTMTLSPEPSTTVEANTVLAGNGTDNFTFFMIPQDVKTQGVSIVFTFSDGQKLGFKPTEAWVAGTTKTYSISETDGWTSVFEGSTSLEFAYNETDAQTFNLTSYTLSGKSTYPVAAPWKVVGYDADGDDTYSMDEKPSWLASFPESGDGGTAATTESVKLNTDYTDYAAQQQAALSSATSRGTSTEPWDLSLHDVNGNATTRNTANSYIVSAPGYYRIPLVYGNAIKNGTPNSRAYTSTYTNNDRILSTLTDHAGNAITAPWITQTNGRSYSPDDASLLWSDEKDLLTNVHKVKDMAFIEFEVKKENIKNGNAVIQVTQNGAVLWSWHIWVTSADALTTTAIKNYQGATINMAAENLGWKWGTFVKTNYDADRTVKVKLEQQATSSSGKATVIITVTQKAAYIRQGLGPYWQWGRKDPFPNTDQPAYYTGSGITVVSSNNVSRAMWISNPSVFYTGGSGVVGYDYYNMWNMNDGADSNGAPIYGTTMAKTIYDPTPAGFTVPPYLAFTGFTSTGTRESPQTKGTWYTYGMEFPAANGTDSIFMPVTLFRRSDATSYSYTMDDVTGRAGGYYWTSSVSIAGENQPLANSNYLTWAKTSVNPMAGVGRKYGLAIRPVAE